MEEFVNEYLTDDHNIYVGTDAQRKGNKWTFCTVIVFHKHGEGAILLKKLINTPTSAFSHMTERLYRETELSVLAANELTNYVAHDIMLHIDANEDRNYKSGEYQAVMTSLAQGMGYDYRVKPHAWAASAAADHCTRKG